MKRNKIGISLITLVITIIIMIILAGAVILSLSNTNIFDKANEAIDEYNLKQVQSLATLKWMDAYYDPNIKTEKDYEDYIREALENEGINTKIYDIEADDTHVTITPKLDLDSIVANEDLNGTTEIGGIKYTITKGVASVTGYTEELPNEVTIPAVITYENTMCRVMSLGKNAFTSNTNITSVIIKEGVTSIGSYAFQGCSSLTTIEMPEGVTSIGSSTFINCSGLTAIDIPSSVTSIGGGAFSGCSNITTIDIPEGVTSIGSRTFYYCSNLTAVDIPSSVTSIKDSAFMGCKALTGPIRIPDGVTSIENYLFRDCGSLTSIEIPDSVTSIGTQAFMDCKSLTTIDIPEGVTSIGDSAFEDCDSLAEVTIPASVTSIGDLAFGCCSNLTEINVNDKNTNYASEDGILFDKEKTILLCFPEKGMIKDYEIPSGVTSIKNHAFVSCSVLTTLIIPESVTSIGESAFYGSRLTTITIPASVTSIGNFAFTNSSVKDIYYGGAEFPTTVPSGCNLHLNSTRPTN